MGFAGGTKFFVDSIFFKFPTGIVRRSDVARIELYLLIVLDDNNLYEEKGSKGKGEEGLMKACGHEVKGLMSFIDCRVEGLYFPLMVLIDYR